MKNIKNLDFPEIKQNLLNFLKNQEKFTGYNFEGSALNTLIDILAYNTYYQSFYNNMTFNEMFMDSATKRTSVVSLAKMLGYTPNSAKCSTCVVEVTTTQNLNTTDILPKGSLFNCIKDNKSLQFTTTQDYYFKPSGFNSTTGAVTQLSTGAINILEGEIKELSFIHDSAIPFRKYVIPFDNVDVETLTVNVQESATGTIGSSDIWTRVTDITKINQDDRCFFLEENSYGYYTIYFGDGILGKKLEDGNKITVTVLQTSGSFGNGIGAVNPTTAFTTPLGYTTNVLIPSSGGNEKESKDSIKTRAIKSFTTQERAVTAEDYKNIIFKDFPNIKSISTWGGEENNPPEYGKVFISIETEDGLFLTREQKSQISNSLIRNRSVVGITPIIVDPELLYISLNVGIKSDLSKLNLSKVSLQTNIRKKILSFVDKNIGYFDGDFYTNELINEIDSVDESIVGITVNPTIEKRIVIDTFNPQNYIINFKNKLTNFESCLNTISSSAFYYLDYTASKYRISYIEDDAKGKLNIIYYDDNKNKKLLKEIGTVNYATGTLYLNNFSTTSLIGTSRLRLFAAPNEKDIFSERNDLIFLDKLDDKSLLLNIEYIPYRNRT